MARDSPQLLRRRPAVEACRARRPTAAGTARAARAWLTAAPMRLTPRAALPTHRNISVAFTCCPQPPHQQPCSLEASPSPFTRSLISTGWTWKFHRRRPPMASQLGAAEGLQTTCVAELPRNAPATHWPLPASIASRTLLMGVPLKNCLMHAWYQNKSARCGTRS